MQSGRQPPPEVLHAGVHVPALPRDRIAARNRRGLSTNRVRVGRAGAAAAHAPHPVGGAGARQKEPNQAPGTAPARRPHSHPRAHFFERQVHGRCVEPHETRPLELNFVIGIKYMYESFIQRIDR